MDIQTCLSLITGSLGSLKVGTGRKHAQKTVPLVHSRISRYKQIAISEHQTTTWAFRRQWEGPGLLLEESLGKSQKEAGAVTQETGNWGLLTGKSQKEAGAITQETENWVLLVISKRERLSTVIHSNNPYLNPLRDLGETPEAPPFWSLHPLT